LTLLKRRGGMREHRGGEWERTVPDLRQLDLRNDIVDYEERGTRDRAKLQAMVGYCQTAQCRTAQLLEYFAGDVADNHCCGHCDNDVAPPEVGEPELQRRVDDVAAPIIAESVESTEPSTRLQP